MKNYFIKVLNTKTGKEEKYKAAVDDRRELHLCIDVLVSGGHELLSVEAEKEGFDEDVSRVQ